MAAATAEAQSIHRQIALELTEERTRSQEELSRKLSQQTREAEARIDEEKARAVENIRDVTLDVVQSAAERLVGAQVSEQEAETAIGAVLAERPS